MRFRKPDEVQFVFFAFAETAPWIGIGPKLAACDVLETRDSHLDPQNHGLHRPSQELLVSSVRGELNSKLASWRQRIHRIRMFFGAEALIPEVCRQVRETGSYHNEGGIQRVYRLNETT